MKRHGLCNRGLTALEDGQIKRSGSYLDAVELVAKVYQASLNCRKEKMYKKILLMESLLRLLKLARFTKGIWILRALYESKSPAVIPARGGSNAFQEKHHTCCWSSNGCLHNYGRKMLN